MSALTREEELTMAYRLGRLAGRDDKPGTRCPYDIKADPLATYWWVKGYCATGGGQRVLFGRWHAVRSRARTRWRRAWVGNEGRS